MVDKLSPELRDDLVRFLLCDSPDRARLIAELVVRNPGMADMLMDLEADDELRTRFEMDLLGRAEQGKPSAQARSKWLATRRPGGSCPSA